MIPWLLRWAAVARWLPFTARMWALNQVYRRGLQLIPPRRPIRHRRPW